MLTAAEQEAVKVMIASDPTCGVVMRGTGGIRKVRFAPTGRGKSGGTRVVYYYHSDVLPAFLLTIFAKGQKDNLTAAERHEFARIVQVTVETYRR